MTTSPIQHEFIAIDEGHATLLHINERDQSSKWISSGATLTSAEPLTLICGGGGVAWEKAGVSGSANSARMGSSFVFIIG